MQPKINEAIHTKEVHLSRQTAIAFGGKSFLIMKDHRVLIKTVNL